MPTSEEVFEDGFIYLDLFIRLSIIGLILLWMMVEYLFRLFVKCWKHQVVAKVRAIQVFLELVVSSNVILYQYQCGFIVGTDNTDNKITQIFYPCNFLEVKLYGLSKTRQRLVRIGRINGIENVYLVRALPYQQHTQS